MHEEWEIRSLPSEETLEKARESLGKEGRSEWERFRRWKDKGIERNEVRIIRRSINRTTVNLDRWRCWARYWARCRGFGWRQIQVSRKCRGTKTSDTRDKAQSIHQVSISYRGDRNFLDWSTRCRGGVEIAIRKSLEAWQITRCRGGVELAFKNSFSRKEKHKHKCNQACNSTNDPNTILASQNHLSTKMLSTKIPKTHTHTKHI